MLVTEGLDVASGDTIVILEAMKTEIHIVAPVAGKVARLHARPGRTVATCDKLLIIKT